MSDLVVDHPTAELLSGSPDDLGVVASTGVKSEQLSQPPYYYNKRCEGPSQLSENCLGGAGAGGSLLENMREISQYLISYGILAHRVLLVLAAVGRIVGCCFRTS